MTLALPVALVGGLLAAAPAQAATQPLFGTTVDVTLQPSNDSLLGSTAYALSSGGGVQVALGAALAADVAFELYEGATLIASCTVTASTTTCTAGMAALSVGAHSVTARFTQSSVTVNYTGTVFTVQNVAPSVRLEWQDASGAWIDGSGTGLPFFGTTTARCVVTNNSNAGLTFDTFTGSVSHTGGPTITAITGALAAGATGYYSIWSGPVSQNPSAGCGGGVDFPDGSGNGNGTGGGAIAVSGSITASPTPAPGRTVTIAGSSLVPPISVYYVTLDGADVAGPITTPGPDYAFSADVAVPAALAPGMHVITVRAVYSERSIVFAQFAFEVAAPALAATGADATAPVASGILALVAGVLLLLVARRRRV